MDTAREGEDGTNWESRIESYVLPYLKQIAGGNLLCDARSSNLVLCDNLEEWDGVEAGRDVQEGNMYTYGWLMLMYGRNQHIIVK